MVILTNPFLTWGHLIWAALVALLLWPLNKLWDWFGYWVWHSFDLNMEASRRLGRRLTKEERLEIKAKIMAEIQEKAKAMEKEEYKAIEEFKPSDPPKP
jgi:hypothetical protein